MPARKLQALSQIYLLLFRHWAWSQLNFVIKVTLHSELAQFSLFLEKTVVGSDCATVVTERPCLETQQRLRREEGVSLREFGEHLIIIH